MSIDAVLSGQLNTTGTTHSQKVRQFAATINDATASKIVAAPRLKWSRNPEIGGAQRPRGVADDVGRARNRVRKCACLKSAVRGFKGPARQWDFTKLAPAGEEGWRVRRLWVNRGAAVGPKSGPIAMATPSHHVA